MIDGRVADLIENLALPFDPALLRIWLLGPGDLCSVCPMRLECPDQTRCLHLELSIGTTARLDGPFRRFPIGAREVGRVALERQPIVASRELPTLGLADPAWLTTHSVASFAALPMVHEESLVGVLALFARRSLGDTDLRSLAAAARLLALVLTPSRTTSPPMPSVPMERTLAEVQRRAIEETLERTRGRVSGPRGAAAILGLKPTTLHSRMKKLGVRRIAQSRA